MLKLYTGPLSLFSRKIEIALREKDISYEREFVPFTQERGYEPRHPAILAHSPKRQVPLLMDGDLALFDSTIILEYLEECYPEPALYPTNPQDRARCRMLELDADEILFAPVRHLLFRTEPPHPDTQTHAARVSTAKEAEIVIIRRFVELNADLGKKDFFCGAFSVADIGFFMTIHFTQRLGGPKLDLYPTLGRWYQRLLTRPAFATIADEIAAADRALSPYLFRSEP